MRRLLFTLCLIVLPRLLFCYGSECPITLDQIAFFKGEAKSRALDLFSTIRQLCERITTEEYRQTVQSTFDYFERRDILIDNDIVGIHQDHLPVAEYMDNIYNQYYHKDIKYTYKLDSISDLYTDQTPGSYMMRVVVERTITYPSRDSIPNSQKIDLWFYFGPCNLYPRIGAMRKHTPCMLCGKQPVRAVDAPSTLPVTNEQYTLTLTPNNASAGWLMGSGNYTAQQRIKIQARPNVGWAFVGWYEGDNIRSEHRTDSIQIHTNTKLEARFTPAAVTAPIVVSVSKLSTPLDDGTTRYTGKLLAKETNTETDIYYTKTQSETDGSYHTVYKVFDSRNNQLYFLTADHEKATDKIRIETQREGLGQINISPFKPNEYCWIDDPTSVYSHYVPGQTRRRFGLIVNDSLFLDTTYTMMPTYGWVYSFADTTYTFPNINLMRHNISQEVLMLDKVTPEQLRLHRRSLFPTTDSVDIARQQQERIRAEEERKKKEEQERIAQEQELKRQDSIQRDIKRYQSAQDEFRNRYASKLVYSSDSASYAAKLDEAIHKYLATSPCQERTLRIPLILYADTNGRLYRAVADSTAGKISLTYDEDLLITALPYNLTQAGFSLPIESIKIDKYRFKVGVRYGYMLNIKEYSYSAKFYYNENRVLMNTDDIAVGKVLQQEFEHKAGDVSHIHRAKVTLCSIRVGARLVQHLASIESTK